MANKNKELSLNKPLSTTPPKSDGYVQRTLSKVQFRKVIAACKNDPKLEDLYDAVRIISNTGIRSGELRELRWADVDFKNCRLTVKGKSSSSRLVPFGPKSLEFLKSRRERVPESEFVLAKFDRITRELHTLAKQIAVKHLCWYAFRRTFVSRLANAGASIATILTIGGWKSAVSPWKTLLTSEQEFEIATREQQKLEEAE